MSKFINRIRHFAKARRLKQAREEFDAAAHALVGSNRSARAAGTLYTSEMEAAGERLMEIQQRLVQAQADFDQATGGPEPVELTDLVLRKVRQSFSPAQQAEAILLLEKECADTLVLMKMTMSKAWSGCALRL